MYLLTVEDRDKLSLCPTDWTWWWDWWVWPTTPTPHTQGIAMMAEVALSVSLWTLTTGVDVHTPCNCYHTHTYYIYLQPAGTRLICDIT